MIRKYEKLEDSKDEKGKILKNENGKNIKKFKEVPEKDAEYIHICGHDENPPQPCRRIKIK